MNAPRLVRLALSLTAAVMLLAGTAVQSPAAETTAAAKPVLSDSDCVKCHSGPPADIAAAGGWHKKVGCTNCHEGHRPSSKNNIPQCSQCHEGKPHFDSLKGQCLKCHRNPHTPLKITFTSTMTDPCLTCHTQQISQLRQFKSKHSALYCSTCHSVHRMIPKCVQCHTPHSPQMAPTECKKCHRAHQPKNVQYKSDVPSVDCAACHKKEYDLLTHSHAKHKALACAYCHQERHKMMPKCQDCHGVPHPAGIMAKFPRCGECHNIAHDLNHWPAASTGGTEYPAPTHRHHKKR